MAELAQLRRQVETYQQQSNEVASLRADTHATRDTLEETRHPTETGCGTSSPR